MGVEEFFRIGKGTKIYEPVSIVREGHYVDIGENCRIGQFTFIGARRFIMMEGAEICPQVTISGGGEVVLGRYSTVDFGARLIPATFTTKGRYMNDVIPERSRVVRGSITLGEGAVIGSNAVVCVSERFPDIVIGDFSVVGAGSYIDSPIPRETIVHPRKVLISKRRFTDG